MRVLVACEFSGIVRDAFAAKGHDAWSCDLLPTEKPGQHIQGDVMSIPDHGFDLMIAHPPCQYLCNSGVRWLGTNEDRWRNMSLAAKFFKRLLESPIDRICIENPVMHGYAKDIIRASWTQTIQPWQFGDNYKKRTCLWLKNLPPLVPTSDLDGSTAEAAVHKASPGPDRWKERSRTYPGFAAAMAEQWSNL